MDRNLDGYYFRIERDGNMCDICWSDLTEDEMRECIASFDKDSCVRLCIGLGKIIKEIGDEFGILGQ